MNSEDFINLAKKHRVKYSQAKSTDRQDFYIPKNDGHTIIVMFDPQSEFRGIQRLQGAIGV